jgi:hypothetical protein
MKEERLDQLLKNLAQRRQPDLPPAFNSTVWSKIENREKQALTGRRGRLGSVLAALSTPRWAAAAFLVAVLIGWGLGRIGMVPASGQQETRQIASVTGEVIDMGCYYDDGSSGPAHAECARMCIASGLPVGLKTASGKVYVLIGKQVPPQPEPGAKHETLNAQLAPYAAKILTVTGTIISKNGLSVIENTELIGEQAQNDATPERLAEL